MPAIIIKDYQWRQTEKKIIIYVPLKGCPKNVDLFVMDNYVKVYTILITVKTKCFQAHISHTCCRLAFRLFFWNCFSGEMYLKKKANVL